MLRRYVLIFHSGALGDFVLTWPLALALGRLHPQSRIVYITQGQKGALAERVLGVEFSDVESGWHHLFSDGDGLPEKSKKLLTGAHSIVSFVSDGKDQWAANAAKVNPDAKLDFLPARPPADYPSHATDFMLDHLRAHPAIYSATDQMLRSIAERGLGKRQSDRRTILVHPGSGAREKCWPVDRFAELVSRVHGKTHTVRVIVGEVEQERLSEEDLKRLSDVAEVSHLTSYVELVDQLKTADGFLGNDSGPTHLAGLMAVPTLALFGPTDPRVWRPLGPKVHTLRHQPLAELSVPIVQAAASTWLKLN